MMPTRLANVKRMEKITINIYVWKIIKSQPQYNRLFICISIYFIVLVNDRMVLGWICRPIAKSTETIYSFTQWFLLFWENINVYQHHLSFPGIKMKLNTRDNVTTFCIHLWRLKHCKCNIGKFTLFHDKTSNCTKYSVDEYVLEYR